MGRRLCAIALVTATACLGDVRTLSAQAEIWRPVGPQGAYVYALAIDPWTPTTLYAALFIDGTSGGHGVFKSTNGGSSWSPANTGLPQPHPIGSLAVDPVNPAILYAGWNYIYSGNVFKTRDGGGNWSAATGINGNGNVRTVVINPQTPATVYAGTTGEPTRSTVLKSTDSGVHWTATSHGLPSRNFS